jgi:hypothetical protein
MPLPHPRFSKIHSVLFLIFTLLAVVVWGLAVDTGSTLIINCWILFVYVVLIVVLLLICVIPLLLLGGKFTLASSRKFMVAGTCFFAATTGLIYLLPGRGMDVLQTSALIVTVILGMAALFLFLPDTGRTILGFGVLVGYTLLELLSALFIARHSGISYYIDLLYPADKIVRPAMTVECLSGCTEHPAWTAKVMGSGFVYQNTVLHVSRPGWHDVTHEYNNVGLRGPDVTYESDKYRILILGDSFIEGSHVNNHELVGAQLQALLDDLPAENNLEFEVLQIGIGGWFSGSAYQYYAVEGYKFNPSLVFYAYTPYDVTDAYRPYFFPHTASDFYEIVNDEIHSYATPLTIPESVQGSVEALGRSLYENGVRTPLIKMMVAVTPLDRILGGEVLSDGAWNDSYDALIADAGVVQSGQLIGDIFSLWHRRVQADDATLAILFLHEAYADEAYITDELIYIDRYGRELLSMLDIPVIDTLEPLQAALQRGVQVNYANFNDGHFTPQGQHELAVVIFDWLTEQGIVTSDPPR